MIFFKVMYQFLYEVFLDDLFCSINLALALSYYHTFNYCTWLSIWPHRSSLPTKSTDFEDRGQDEGMCKVSDMWTAVHPGKPLGFDLSRCSYMSRADPIFPDPWVKMPEQSSVFPGRNKEGPKGNIWHWFKMWRTNDTPCNQELDQEGWKLETWGKT